MADFKKIFEALASGSPAKKPVSGNLLKQRAKENEKALKSGFMKMPDYVKKKFNEEEEVKPHKMYKGDKVVVAKNKAEHDKLNKQGYTHDDPKTKKVEEEKKNCGCGQDPCITYGKKQMKESARDNYNPEISDKRTKEKLKKAGLPPESPKVMEARERIRDIFEGKKKGLDGKACWKGYKLQGTKKKGNKTVDDCVPVNEISDALKKRYLAKAGKQITSKEKMKDYQLGQMDKQKDKPASLPREKFTKADKAFVKNKYDKDTLKRRKGMAQARSKLGEAKKPVVHSDKPDSLKTVKIKYNKPIKTKVTDIGPGGKETVRKDWSEEIERDPKSNSFNRTKRKETTVRVGQKRDKKTGKMVDVKGKSSAPQGLPTYRKTLSMKEQQIQLVTNLDFNEGLTNLVSRGLDKVRSSIKDAEKRTGLSVDASKNNKNNPVSGDNIRKRLESQKKRKK